VRSYRLGITRRGPRAYGHPERSEGFRNVQQGQDIYTKILQKRLCWMYTVNWLQDGDERDIIFIASYLVLLRTSLDRSNLINVVRGS
jgi:hypothetical protein